jgi:hypothetical protein
MWNTEEYLGGLIPAYLASQGRTGFETPSAPFAESGIVETLATGFQTPSRHFPYPGSLRSVLHRMAMVQHSAQ